MKPSKDLAKQAALAVAAVAGLELLLCRATEGPPSAVEVFWALVLWGVLALVWALGPEERPVARSLCRVVPAVVYGLGWQVPLLLGRTDWVTGPVVSVLAVGVFVVGPAWRGEPRDLGPRAQVGIALAMALPAWALQIIIEGYRPPTAVWLPLLLACLASFALGRWAALLAPLALLPSTARDRWTAEGPVPEGRDVVLISIDTLRSDHARRMQSVRWLTERGVALDGQAAAPWTLPSMASLLTGVSPARHGAGRVAGGYGRIRPDVSTLAERLSAAGWDTAATAENPYTGPVFGLERGFARFRHESAEPWALPSAPYTRDARPVGATLAASIGLASPSLSGVDRRLFEARELLAERRDRPLFLWVHILDPHLPYTHAWTAPELSLYDRFRFPNINNAVIGDAPSSAVLQALEHAYTHEVDVVDERLLPFLTELSAARDPILVLTSDHGEAFGEHGGWEHGHSMYQELLAVPLVIAGIEGVRPGLTGHPDVVPTILGALGMDAAGTEGRDLRSTEPRPVTSVNTLYGDRSLRAVRTPSEEGPDKQIDGRDGALAFDLDADPTELRPLAPAAQLAELLPPVSLGADSVPLDAQTEQELRALGYLDD